MRNYFNGEDYERYIKIKVMSENAPRYLALRHLVHFPYIAQNCGISNITESNNVAIFCTILTNKDHSRCTFFNEKCIPFINSTL